MMVANLQHLAGVQDLDVPPLIKRQFHRATNDWSLIEPCIVNSHKCPISYRYSEARDVFSIDIPLSVWIDDVTPTCVWTTVHYMAKICETPIVALRDPDDPFEHPRIKDTHGIPRMIRINDLWTAAVNFTTLVTTLAACLSAPLRPMKMTGQGATWLSVHCFTGRPVRMQADTAGEIMRNLETSVVASTASYNLAYRGRWLDRARGDDVPLEQYGIALYEAPLIVTFKPQANAKIEAGDYY